jgi:hypothetical protein
MIFQLVTQIGGVREEYVPGAGATPPCGLPRRLTPRWSLPPPAHLGIQKISGADISLICAGYKPDQFSITR